VHCFDWLDGINGKFLGKDKKFYKGQYLFTIDWAIAQDNFEIFTPEFIPVDGSFEISIITSNKYPDADRLELLLAPDISISIISTALLSRNQIFQLPVKNEFNDILGKSIRKIVIDLKDSTKISEKDFFQIIISFNSPSANKSALKLSGEFKKGDSVLGYLVNSKISSHEDTNFIYVLQFEYYQKFPIAGKSLSITQGYYLNIPLTYEFDELMTVEFWMKITNPVSTFLEIINWETNKIESNISINDNQLVFINAANNELLPVNSFFLSTNSWYYFKIIFNKLNSELTFFCDGNELCRFQVFNGIDFENLVLHFQNDRMNSEYFLEQLRIIKSTVGKSSTDRNKYYQDYFDNSSALLLQINFTEAGLNKLLNKKSIFYEKIKLVNSDAPIFPRSPEINVTFSDNYYEIEWQGGNYKYAFEYVVEKAIGESDFLEIERVTSDNSIRKIYSVVSDRNNQPEVVYFRIKQINKDGTVVYSEAVKIGQGIIDDVIIGQNFPNPFNPTTLIEFELIRDSDVEVKVYNLAGKEITVLHKGFLNKGFYQFKFDAEGFPSGVYVYQINTPFSSQTRKMILAK
jgi:hypothetical protein